MNYGFRGRERPATRSAVARSGPLHVGRRGIWCIRGEPSCRDDVGLRPGVALHRELDRNGHRRRSIDGGNLYGGRQLRHIRLTLAPGVYTGQNIQIRIQWASSASNYDLYAHKCPTPASTASQCNATAPISQSTSASSTEEVASFDPAVTGVGDFTVHVVYLVGGPSDQYTGSASLVPATAVRLVSFDARRESGNRVRVRWRTAGDLGLLGFHLFRASGAAPLLRINRTLIPASGALRGRSYSWVDRRAPRRGVRYRLQVLSSDGSRSWLGSALARRG